MIGLFLTACTKETKETIIIVEVPVEGDPVQQDPDDTDGDGVKNIIEEIDSTNPNDPCSYLDERQIYADTSEAWRNLDCDGDGVTNGNEVDPDGNNNNEDNGTDPRDGCDLEQSQQTVTPAQEWLQLDCDEDGVANGQEVIDGTNALDPCSLVLGSQTTQPEGWLALDCDDDCVRNELELEDGTDPFDGDDFLGNGKTLYQLMTTTGRFISLDENGTRLSTITEENGTTSFTFNYTNDKLTSAQTIFGDFMLEYQNNLVTKITKTINGNAQVNDLEHQGNVIVVTGTNAAPGTFYIRLTFDPTGQFLLTKERFFYQNNEWTLALDTISYSSTTNRASGMLRKLFDYNVVTGELTERLFEGIGTSYQYYGNINNPLKEAIDRIKTPVYIAPELVSIINGRLDIEYTLFEDVGLRRWNWANQTFTDSNTFRINCTNAQGNPTRGERSNQFGEYINDIIYLYE